MTAKVVAFLQALFLSLHPWSPPPPLGGGWAALRQCESGGNYNERLGEPNGGAYQFAPGTWAALHTGYPSAADAPYWVQDWEAFHLWLARGRTPWPVCGRFL